MKKILFYALGVLLPVAVCLAVYSYEKPITDPTVMANLEALTDDEKPIWSALPKENGPTCCVYVNGVQVEGKKSVCYKATVSQYCTNGVCMIN